ncbi:MAG: tetratricopeptide repeat protein [Bacteroidia bacterium]|nr:tetratricopeptide repeat protein [Bacteroidia bacterium]MBT8267882.1 tetratricopeptide repeat protein [Bacteroidia bacterium]NNF83142.1 tetratricopeptide repeat protein [Flavobacteriaceae bacterium]NNK71240.1 tetratricopeptide repeat protein [Flavobacteriaceae bacterium]NNL79770.1 tetratricopeptide repeat protein [Flavobacteriaceae bacterium]
MRKALIIILLPISVLAQSLKIEVDQLFREGDYNKAAELLTEYLDNKPVDYLALELLGDSYGHQKQWDDAVRCYEQLAKTFPGNANYHYKHGGALGMKALSINKFRALGLIDDIKEAFHSAADLDPQHVDTRWALVELYIQLPGIIGGSYKKALKYAQELEELSEVDGFLAKGYVYENKGETGQAENYYRKAVKVGGSITCYDKLTEFYEKQKAPAKAITSIEQANARHNRNALHYQLGKVSADYGVQLDKGERCLKTFIQNHSSQDGVPVEWAYYRLAQISKHRHDKTEALKWIDKALQIRANFKQALKEKETIQAL